MADGSERRELLDRLRINRDDEEDDDKSGRWLIVGLMAACGLLAVFALYVFWPSSGETNSTVANADPSVTADNAATKNANPKAATSAGGILSASGYVTARRLATVSSEITGRMSEVLIEEGMLVKEGQVLARLDATLAKIDVGSAEGSLKSARGALSAAVSDNEEAKRVLVRVRGMKEKDFASNAQITQAEAAAEAAAARLQQAQGGLASALEALNRARAILDKHEVRAPFAGVVTTKAAQPGEIVSPVAAGGGFTRTGVCTIVDMNSLEVEVEVNESFISRVKPDQKAIATLDAYPDWDIPAKVVAIIPTANRDKATVKVRVGLEARDPRILPDMAAKVLFFDETKELPPPSPTPAPAKPS